MTHLKILVWCRLPVRRWIPLRQDEHSEYSVESMKMIGGEGLEGKQKVVVRGLWKSGRGGGGGQW